MTSSDWEMGFLGQEQTRPTHYFVGQGQNKWISLPHRHKSVSGLGQLNLQTITGAMGVNTNELQKNIQTISEDAEMYVYAQLGLQTVATVATFGFFLITLYTFLKKRKAGSL